MFDATVFSSGFVICIAYFSVLAMRRILWKKTVDCTCIGNKGHAVITGASSGIGLATAVELAKRNWRLTLGCRNVEYAEKIYKEISSVTNNHTIAVLPLDLQDCYSIRNFVNALPSDPINVLINNAGIFPRYSKTVSFFGREFDSVLTTNFIGPFYLTSLLMPHLKSSAQCLCELPRVINVSSSLSAKSRLTSLEELFDPNWTESKIAYANSKLACNLFSRQLHQKYGIGEQRCIKVFSTFTGGMVYTNLHREFINHYPLPIQWFLKVILKLLLKSPHEGCQSIVHCAVSKDVCLAHQHLSSNTNVSDQLDSDLLIDNCVPIKWPENCDNFELADMLWTFTLNLLNSK